MSMKNATLSLVLATLVPGLALATETGTPPATQPYVGPDPKVRTVTVTVGGKTVLTVIADTDLARTRGLLDWVRIADDSGMILDFGAERQAAIHMQGMKFPIDAVWIDRNGVITMTYESIQPNSGTVYPSIFPSRFCLELNAGFCKRYGVTIGQKVAFGVSESHPR